MNTEDFLLQVKNSIANVLCIDFDGVIHDHHLGFHDGTIYGEPLEGAIDAIKSLSKHYKLVIYTCKANPDRPLINGQTGCELVWDWLEKYNVKQYIDDVVYTKPNAVAYIDDKAIKFVNWEQTCEEVKRLG